MRFFPGLVIDFSECFHVIGNERHRYYAHLANSFVRQMAEGLVQGRLQPSAGAYFTLIAQPVRVAPSAALGEETDCFFDLPPIRVALLNH